MSILLVYSLPTYLIKPRIFLEKFPAFQINEKSNTKPFRLSQRPSKISYFQRILSSLTSTFIDLDIDLIAHRVIFNDFEIYGYPLINRACKETASGEGGQPLRSHVGNPKKEKKRENFCFLINSRNALAYLTQGLGFLVIGDSYLTKPFT